MTEGGGHRNPQFAGDLNWNEESTSVNNSLMTGSIASGSPGLAVGSDDTSKAGSMNSIRPTVTKRRRETTDDASRSDPKRDFRAQITGHTYRQFQLIYNFPFSHATFVGLCAYLHVLQKWGCAISVSAYDAFLYRYLGFSEMRNTMLEYQRQSGLKMPAYHLWFTEGQLGCLPEGHVLDENILGEISNENPYTFGRTEAGMDLIATNEQKVGNTKFGS